MRKVAVCMRPSPRVYCVRVPHIQKPTNNISIEYVPFAHSNVVYMFQNVEGRQETEIIIRLRFMRGKEEL